MAKRLNEVNQLKSSLNLDKLEPKGFFFLLFLSWLFIDITVVLFSASISPESADDIFLLDTKFSKLLFAHKFVVLCLLLLLFFFLMMLCLDLRKYWWPISEKRKKWNQWAEFKYRLKQLVFTSSYKKKYDLRMCMESSLGASWGVMWQSQKPIPDLFLPLFLKQKRRYHGPCQVNFKLYNYIIFIK